MVRNVILTWYSSTNEHLPVEEFESLLAEDVEMLYPDTKEPLKGKAAFRSWYGDVLKKYFDETHEVDSWDIKIADNKAFVTVFGRWEFRSWVTGEARSKYSAILTRQRFEITRSMENGRVTIDKKIVETFEKTAPIYGVRT